MKKFEEYNKEIRKSIIDQWTKEGHVVKNMENDPVVNLLLSALSYQAYQIHKNINQYEEKILREFRDRILPFHLIKPFPSFSIIETKLKEGCSEKMIDETCSFDFVNSKKQKLSFTPLLNTKIINAELTIVNQLAENIWNIALQCATPVDSLSGLSFYIDTEEFIEIESVQYNGEELPLIKPSQYNDLPFTKWFNCNHLLLNQNYYLFGTYDYWQEVFLTNSTQLYYIDQCDKRMSLNKQTTIELEIAFNSPIDINNILKINCIPIVNVEKKEVTLDNRTPVRDLDSDTGEFLNLLCDKEDENDFDNILIRQHGVERYNSNQLFEQIQEMLYRYNSDYYAFQNIRELNTTDQWENLQNIMNEIRNIVNKSDEKMIKEHYYAMLKKGDNDVKKVDLKYLITAGASANGIKKGEKITKTHISIDNNKTTLLLETKGGSNGVKNEIQKEDIAKYYFQTKDRLVTPADIIVFIKTFYYGDRKLDDEIENIATSFKNEYIDITIKLKNDNSLSNIKEQLSKILQTKIMLRTSGVLPFKVQIL